MKKNPITYAERGNASVNMFMRSIRKSEPLSSAEEFELWRLMRQGSEQARTKLIYANLRYVVTIANKYVASGAPYEDLIMAGSLGITKAADLFDASLGYRFITFATWYIENEIRKTAYDHLQHTHNTTSFDEPIDADDNDSDTRINLLHASSEVAPDWHMRYQDTLHALKQRLDRLYWKGAGKMLDDYITMNEQGLTSSDFARKYKLTSLQLKRFLDMVRAESRQYLDPAA